MKPDHLLLLPILAPEKPNMVAHQSEGAIRTQQKLSSWSKVLVGFQDPLGDTGDWLLDHEM